MAEKIAKIHRNQSNRAKVQPAADRKVVFKGVLDNPFRIDWPNTPLNIQNTLLALVVSLLEGVADYQHEARAVKRKRKHVENTNDSRKRTKVIGSTLNVAIPDETLAGADTSIKLLRGIPPVLHHVTIGINEVTKELESLAKLSRETLPEKDPQAVQPLDVSSARLVLVCREDVDPPILINHIPHLVAACNSTRLRQTSKFPIYLVSLSKGAESTLAAAMGLRRAAVMTIKSSAPGFEKLTSLLDSMPILRASWLAMSTVPQPRTPRLIPTHIKQLRTTAPKDMKAAKEQRSIARALVKERRKAKLNAKIPKVIKLTS